jgi:thrombospondin type 3 repeat protein
VGHFGWGWAVVIATGVIVFSVPSQAAGPDVVVADLDHVRLWGEVGGITAYSVGTISCNVGDQPLQWEESTNQHPVIAQNMYRLKGGRFEQIGQSWVKHGILALNDTFAPCSGNCASPNPDSVLHPGCADPYSSSLNGMQSKLGPRAEINASTGSFAGPPGPPGTLSTIDRRVQVHNTDLDAGLNAGAVYFVEGVYVTPDDAAAGNDDNNVSYRPVSVAAGTYAVAVTGTTQQSPAIQAWKDTDSTVALAVADVPSDGRVIVAGKATDLGNGVWGYEYAVQNLNSDRSVGSFGLELQDAAPVEDIGFHDVDYHSGEPFDGTDWSSSRPPGMVMWSTTAYDVNGNANALRWGTLYNFRFQTTNPPIPNAVITLGLFKPGSPESVTVSLLGPAPSPVDCNANMIADFLEIQGDPSLDCDTNGNLDECDLDCDGDGTADACEILLNPLLDCDGDSGLDTCQIPVSSPAAGGPFFCTANCDPDCNSNGVPDSCDIASLEDPDCNSNGIPDSCDIAASVSDDCNSNGIPDDCDIAGPLEEDCNTNTIPDGCEIAADPGLDCNDNGIIDACGEADCNNDLIPDGCEADSDGDSHPDVCDNCPEMANPGQDDADADGIGDVCDAAPPPGELPVAGCCGSGVETVLALVAGMGLCGFRRRSKLRESL